MSLAALRLLSTIQSLNDTTSFMRGQPCMAIDGLMELARIEAAYLIGLM